VLEALDGTGAEARMLAMSADQVSARFVPLPKGPEALAASTDTRDAGDWRTPAPAGARAGTAPGDHPSVVDALSDSLDGPNP
jgi:hypothetical protein